MRAMDQCAWCSEYMRFGKLDEHLKSCSKLLERLDAIDERRRDDEQRFTVPR